MTEKIEFNNIIYALIIRSNYNNDGITFLTPDDFSQQLAFMKHPVGKEIVPHIHNAVPREVHFTNEVLFIRRGKLRVDFYDVEKQYIESRILESGDVILLVGGGHGFQILEELEMIEVKQGPYAGEADKTRFSAINDSEIVIK